MSPCCEQTRINQQTVSYIGRDEWARPIVITRERERGRERERERGRERGREGASKRERERERESEGGSE